MTALETKRFGRIEITDCEADLPAYPPQTEPIFLSVHGIIGSPDLLLKVAAFLDAIPDRVEAARRAFMADPEDLSFVSESMFLNIPDDAARLFPNAKTAQDVSRADLWGAMGIRQIWAADADALVIDFEFVGAAIDHVFAAYFDYNGALQTLTMES